MKIERCLSIALAFAGAACRGDAVGVADSTTSEASTGDACIAGSHGCPCTAAGSCDPGMTCIEDVWICAGADTTEGHDATSAAVPDGTGGDSSTSATDESSTGAGRLDDGSSDTTTTTASSGDGSTSDGSTSGGSTSDGSTSDGSTSGGSTSGGSTSGGSTSGGSTSGGSQDVCMPAGLSFDSAFLDADSTVNTGSYMGSPGWYDLALDSTRGRVYLSRGGDDEVEIVDLTAGASVTVATGNTAEHLYFDPVRDEVVVTLPTQAHSGSWSTDDQEGCVSTIDAEALALEPPWWIPLDPWDVVTDHDSHAYIAGASGQWTSAISVNLDDGEHEFHTGNLVRHGTNIDIHPNLDRIYGADNGISPSDIERYDIEDASIAYAYDSPYHGDYPMCGDVRVHPAGATLYTPCGHIFQTTNVAASDMTWTGDLGMSWDDIAFAPDMDLAFVVVADAPVLFVFDTVTLAGVGTYDLSAPADRILAGPDYLVLVRNVLGGAPSTELEVLSYADVLAPQPGTPGIVVDDDPTVSPGTYLGDPSFFDAVLDTERGRVFLSHGLDGEVEVVDLTAGASASLPTPYRAEHMYFDPNLDEIFVALPIDDHSPYWWDEDQEGYVASIDAVSLSVSNPRWFPLDPWQLVSDGSGVVHLGGASGQWTSAISVDLSTGWFQFHQGFSVRDMTSVQIHPDLDRIYGANTGSSPSDIERYDVMDGYLQYVDDSPYHGDYPMCGDLRIHPDGSVIHTRCGHVFLASNVAAADMTWTADLGVTWTDLVFEPSGMGAYVITDGSPTITTYDAAALTPLSTYDLPSVPERLLAGPSHLVALRPVAGATAIDVIPYSDL